jgi:hypothetical protein
MDHMDYIESIALSDVRVLVEKESTYKGSWKAAGGRSAWFMARRNADRLINMMAPPPEPELFRVQNVLDLAENIDKAGFGGGMMNVEVHTSVHNYAVDLKYLCDSHIAEDIFAKIDEHPDGEDGTVLAVVRDLRRYLLLVESEMKSRWDRAKQKTEEAAQRARVEEILARQSVVETERRVPRMSEASRFVPEAHAEFEAAINTADYVEPWIVSDNYFMVHGISVENREKFWNCRAPSVHVLEPHVESAHIPRGLHGIYILNANENSWTLDIRCVPASIRSYFPDLGREKNMKEHEDLPKWQQVLYVWNKDGQKYHLSSINLEWHVEK